MAGRVRLLDCEIDALDLAATLDRCSEIIRVRIPTQHVAINAAKIVALRQDSHLRKIVASCGLASADGQAIVWASRLLGRPLPERVSGIDLMHALFDLAEREGHRIFILGARQDVLETAIERIRLAHPRLVIAGHRNGYFEDSESVAVCEEVRDAKPDILFVAISSPRKEYWLADHAHALGVPLVMGVGGAIDVVAGFTQRAPMWMQRAGLEWLFRLAQEPQRLWRRYLVTNTIFMALVLRALLSRESSAQKKDAGHA